MKMPIVHRALSTGHIDTLESTSVNLAAVLEGLRSAVHFNVQVASELYWQGKQNDYSLDSDFGSFRLPYPTMWLEWEIPRMVTVQGKSREMPRRTLVGCLLTHGYTGRSGTEVRFGSGDDPSGIQALICVADPDPATPVRFIPAMSQFRITPEGAYVDGSLLTVYDKSFSESKAREMAEMIQTHQHVAYLALTLIHCRNVTTRKAGDIGLRRSGAEKRRGAPRIEYHTIVLPGMPVEREKDRRARKPTRDLMAVHRVRGHFKTFTADAPLLGQHVGTYWWGWQVRGSTKNGMVVSDYEMAK